MIKLWRPASLVLIGGIFAVPSRVNAQTANANITVQETKTQSGTFHVTVEKTGALTYAFDVSWVNMGKPKLNLKSFLENATFQFYSVPNGANNKNVLDAHLTGGTFGYVVGDPQKGKPYYTIVNSADKKGNASFVHFSHTVGKKGKPSSSPFAPNDFVGSITLASGSPAAQSVYIKLGNEIYGSATVNFVPEAGSLALLVSGLAPVALVWYRRQGRRTS